MTNAGACVVDASRSPYAALRPVPVSAVTLEGGLWGERYRTNVEVALPGQHRMLEAAGTLANFRRAAAGAAGSFQGLEFADTDLYKWLEAASWVLAQRSDEGLRRRVEEGVALIEAAQGPDGYLDTFYAGARGAERWSNLRSHHELYCAGHLIQAGVAHHRSTGDDRLLRVARRCADLVCSVFGPASSGRRPGIDGHPGVELALVELFRETRERRYLEQARYFLEARGHGLLGDGGRLGRAYYQDAVPFLAMEAMSGHAVRALYYVAGMTDLFLETGAGALLETLTRLWERMVSRQLYVSGGLGARCETESFGADLELPSGRACCETCAAVGSVMWCHRMLLATGEARHADLLEWTLFNALLPAWSLDGLGYAYVNPLQERGEGQQGRQPWFECACCPPNVARTIASLPGYVYSTSGGDTAVVHLYAQSSARLELAGGAVGLTQRTQYPWDGRVELHVDGEGDFALRLRIPAWCRSGAELHVNGAPLLEAPRGGYLEVRRRWRRGDRLSLNLPMPVQALRCHPGVLENTERVALTRGPLLHCLEAADHPGVELSQVELDPGQAFQTAWRPELLGGVVVLQGVAAERATGEAWRDRLYRPVDEAPRGSARARSLQAIPYLAWANRGPGALQIWLREAVAHQP